MEENMNEKIKIIVSGDYEVFGNGTGDVLERVVEPTDRILDICDRHGARFTIFAEVCEYWAFKEHSKELERDLGYMPHIMIERQLKKAVKRGHDVQLHLHPQWIGADYTGGGWKLNYEWWRLPNLPHGLGSEDDILSLKGLIKKGKETLEQLLREEDVPYECMAFRSGAWCIQPAKEVLLALEANHIRVDSTVAKGRYLVHEPFFVDFRNAHSNCRPWYASAEDINSPSSGGENAVLEVPVFSMPYRRYERIPYMIAEKILCKRKADTREGGPYKPDGKVMGTGTPVFEKIFGEKYYFWDISNSFRWNRKMYMDSFKKRPRGKGLVLVMEGHPKTFFNGTELERTLSYLSEESSVEFVKYKDVVSDLADKKR